MGKSIDAAKALLEEMASNNYHWSSERAAPRRGGGRHEADAVTLLANRVALAQSLKRVATSPGTFAGPSMGAYVYCETCGVQGHTTVECCNAPSSIEHVNAFHNFNLPPQNDPHSTTYGQGWKSHPNALYKNPHPHPQSSPQRPIFHNRAPYNPPTSPPEPKSHLESLMERFIVTQTKTNKVLVN